MEKMRSKWKKQEGFTLVEMLIVVAIIAILVAVSIPIVNNALERTRKATDAANERAAKAALMVAYLTEEPEVRGLGGSHGQYFAYDAMSGKLIELVAPISTTLKSVASCGKCEDHKDSKLVVQYKNNEILTFWIDKDINGTQIDDYFERGIAVPGIKPGHNGKID